MIKTLALILKEIYHRKVHFLLSLLAVVTAVALFIAFFTAGLASNRETTRLMRDIGFNLRIIPKATDMNQFLLTGVSDAAMPESYVHDLADREVFSYNHLVATLHRKITWRDRQVILTGLAPEVAPKNKKTPPMIYAIKPGTVYLGYRLADDLDLRPGDTIEINGKSLTVANCLSERGNADDIRIQCHLPDAQEILGLPGRINEIQAIDCLCFIETDDPVAILRQEITSILPEAQVVQIKSIASARTSQRRMAKKYFAFIMPCVVVVCGAWIAVLALMNVRQRRTEIGLLRALGYGSGRIAFLFLGKAVLIGLIGAVLGFLIGTALALEVGPRIFTVTAKAIKPEYTWLYWSLLAAPAFAAVSSFIPVTIAVAHDPAQVLRDE